MSTYNDAELTNSVIKEGDVVEVSDGWRFAPEYNPSERKRLTGIPTQAAESPEAREIDLEPYANQRIRVRGLHNHSDWVYSARIAED
ncbi:MAG TPA: hypothetical protein VF596_09960 [Pyrinomonadaceae bacterium]|jgi:hypothetical protein